jgi:hypothetical protein
MRKALALTILLFPLTTFVVSQHFAFADTVLNGLTWGSETTLKQSSQCPTGSVVVNVFPQWNGSYNDTMKVCRTRFSTAQPHMGQ